MAKLYNVSGGMKLHDARRVLGVPVIAHTGRVNAYARCMGGKLKGHYDDIRGIRSIMKASVSACGGIAKTDTASRAARQQARKIKARK